MPDSSSGSGSNTTDLPLPTASTNVAKDATATTVGDSGRLVEFQIADDQLSQQSCDDPLSDPLALDDCLQFDEYGLQSTIDGVAHSADVDTEIRLVDVSLLTQHATNDADLGATELMVFDEVVADIVDLVAEQTSSCVEEGGGRSDGSDSGLGLESTSCSDVTPTRTAAAAGKCGARPHRTAFPECN